MVLCDNLVKIYKTSELEVMALQGLDLAVEKGELIAIIGNSGSGKSTLLNMLGGLDRPSAGRLLVDGQDLLKMNRQQMVLYKRKTAGFVWQNNARNLIPYLTAIENVELPMLISAVKEKREKALNLLDMVGLKSKKDHQLFQLSGGEQQRVAIAIALANDPKLLLADEPTGSVDTKSANTILELFKMLNSALGLTIIIVTHDMQLSRKVNRIVNIRNGRTSSEFIMTKSYLEELEELEENQQAGEVSHIELSVIDKVGRLQIPAKYLESLGIKGKDKVKVALEDDRITLQPYKLPN
ncbi:MAG: ATP-binding cassette domain-containing protein [Clostridia bacterium]|nr:ATP-binding cassette domain-containing protein [Clostridia bacterium]